MTKVLLTGFEPFGIASQIPSTEIVNAISDNNIISWPTYHTVGADG